MMATRERDVFHQMKSVHGFPRWAGEVRIDGATLQNAVSHHWIEGRTFHPRLPVPDDWFPELPAMVSAFHERGMAYADMPKRENLIVGSDGRPYLLNYQIRFRPPAAFRAGRFLRTLQDADMFFLRRHWHRCRGDQCAMPTAPPVVRLAESPGKVWRMFRTTALLAAGVRDDPRRHQT